MVVINFYHFSLSLSLYDKKTFSYDTITIADNINESSSAFQAYGMPFTLDVNTYDVADSQVTGFNLVFNQLPGGESTHMRIANIVD